MKKIKTDVRSNLELRHWLKHCNVDSNKQMTSLSREAFTMIYQYHNLITHHIKFNSQDAKLISFFVMSTPDHMLSDLIQSFDVYRYYLMASKSHQTSGYCIYESDLTTRDRQVINLIFSLYKPSDYDDMSAVVMHDRSFIMPKALNDSLTTRDIIRLNQLADEHNMNIPIEVKYEDGELYLQDATQKVNYRKANITLPKKRKKRTSRK